MEAIVPIELIEKKIYLIRGQKVMLDRDLTQLYDVETRVLNQAVRKNIDRFPPDFMFSLTREESREDITNCDILPALQRPEQPSGNSSQYPDYAGCCKTTGDHIGQ